MDLPFVRGGFSYIFTGIWSFKPWYYYGYFIFLQTFRTVTRLVVENTEQLFDGGCGCYFARSLSKSISCTVSLLFFPLNVKSIFSMYVYKRILSNKGALFSPYLWFLLCVVFFFWCSARGTLGEIRKVTVYYLFMYLFIHSHVVFFCASFVCSPDFVRKVFLTDVFWARTVFNTLWFIYLFIYLSVIGQYVETKWYIILPNYIEYEVKSML